MASRLVRSIFWLCSLSGLGYGLLILTTPSQSNVNELKQKLGSDKQPKEALSKNQQFMNVLQAATNNSKPIYRLSKEEIEKELNRK
ncbi:uncharacterized protein isoform X2 [Leptinotarsa decemlineata]|uniref:uncharacterized protein isoform X2 n=1 Tax=Leptinotarsa decemlineata TaxID=7539 RepID=UPI003D309EE8